MKKKLTFILLLFSFSLAYGQLSISENPYFYMLVTKSMGMKNGKIDFIEHKKIKGIKKPLTTYYTLIFSKDISYKTENKKINIHFFNEQDSILYLVNDNASYLIDYKKKEVLINETDEVIFFMRKKYPFANFYSNQAGGNLLLMGRIRDSVKTDFSTTILVAEQKIFTELYNLQSKTTPKNHFSEEKLFCYDKYEFRNTDTLLIQYVSKISNPYNYEKGTIVEIETKLLHALLDDQEYEKPYYYNYEEFCNDGFHFYDKRKSLVVDEYIYHGENLEKDSKTRLLSLIAETNVDDIYSSNFLELEDGMMSLYLQVREGQQEIAAQKKEWQEVTDIRIFNMNLYTLPTKAIMPTLQNEIKMANASFIIPLDTIKIALEEYLDENQIDTMIVDDVNLLSENIQEVIEDTTVSSTRIELKDSLSKVPFKEELIEIIISELESKDISERDIAENIIVDMVFSDTEIEDDSLIAITEERFLEDKYANVIIAELKAENILTEEIPTADFAENISVDTLISGAEAEDNILTIFTEEEFINEEVENVEFETEDVLAEEIIWEKFAISEFIDSVFLAIEVKNTVNEKITDPIISESLVKIDINEIDSCVSRKDELHIDTIISLNTVSEVTDDSLVVAENMVLVSDSLEKTATIENVNVTVIYLEASTKEDLVSETLENEAVYYIVLNYFKDMENAKVFFNERKKLYDNLLHLGKDASSGTYMVGIGPYKTENEAQDALDNMWVSNVRGWIIQQ